MRVTGIPATLFFLLSYMDRLWNNYYHTDFLEKAMSILLFLAIAAAVLFLIIFLPTAFSRCYCCGIIKPWIAFRLLNSRASLSEGRICRKCCSRYGINSVEELQLRNKVRLKVETEFYDKQKKHLHHRQ